MVLFHRNSDPISISKWNHTVSLMDSHQKSWIWKYLRAFMVDKGY